jgi:hypothetical protein
MPREFRFGSDPEFMFVSVRQDGGTARLDANDDPVSGITNHNHEGEIGRNGVGYTAEIRTHPHPTLEALEREILEILDNGANQASRITYTGGRVAMQFGAMPQGVPCGGHIHVTSNDPLWFWSKEALQVLPFFISLATYMYDKTYLQRIAGSSYGQHGDMHPNPDANQPAPATITPPGESPRRARPSGFRGWEYRNPTSWIGPQNTLFRRKLFTAINGVLHSEGDLNPPTGEKKKQIDFIEKVCVLLGGTLYSEVGASNRTSYDRYYSNRRQSDDWIGQERSFLREYFRYAPTPSRDHHFGKLLKAVKDAQDEIHLVGLDEIFNDIVPNDPWRNDNLNPPVIYPMPAPPIPIRLTSFASMSTAITAVKASYAEWVGSTHKDDWDSFGKAWYAMFPCKYAVEGNVARDTYIPEITHLAMSLCVDAVQRRSLKVKFLPRTSQRGMIYGGGEQRSFNGRAPDIVALVPPSFASDPDIRRLMATENLTVADGDDEHIYLRMSFRESSSDLKSILVALFILWKQQYIGGAQTAKHITATVPLGESEEAAV